MEKIGENESFLTVRTRTEVQVWCPSARVWEKSEDDYIFTSFKGNLIGSKWSPDGTYFAVLTEDRGFLLCQPPLQPAGALREVIPTFPEHLQGIPWKQLKWWDFSPRGNYFVTYFVPSGHNLNSIEGESTISFLC